MILDRPNCFWRIKIVLVKSKSFLSVPNNFGQVQIVLVRLVSSGLFFIIWTCPKWFWTWPKWIGPVPGAKSFRTHTHTCRRTRHKRNIKIILGHGDWHSLSVPKLVEALLSVDVSAVSCGPEHVVVVGGQGDVYSWGRGYKGEHTVILLDRTFQPF